MTLDPAKLVSALKFAPHVFFGLALASGLLLFTPASLASALGLTPLLSNYRVWVGAVFLVSISVSVSAALAGLLNAFSPALRDRWNERQWRKELQVLTPPEKEILSEYVRDNTSTLPQPISNGVVGGLVGKGILYRASNVGHPGSTSFDYNLQPWAWRHLRQHPELVGVVPAAHSGRDA